MMPCCKQLLMCQACAMNLQPDHSCPSCGTKMSTRTAEGPPMIVALRSMNKWDHKITARAAASGSRPLGANKAAADLVKAAAARQRASAASTAPVSGE